MPRPWCLGDQEPFVDLASILGPAIAVKTWWISGEHPWASIITNRRVKAAWRETRMVKRVEELPAQPTHFCSTSLF